MRVSTPPRGRFSWRGGSALAGLALVVLGAGCIPWRRAEYGRHVTAQREVYLGHQVQIGEVRRVPGEGAVLTAQSLPMCRTARWHTNYQREIRSISSGGFTGAVLLAVGGLVAVGSGIGAFSGEGAFNTGEIDGFAGVFIGGATMAALGGVLVVIAAADPHDTDREVSLGQGSQWFGEPTRCGPDADEMPTAGPRLSLRVEAGEVVPLRSPQHYALTNERRWSEGEWQTLLAWSRECALAPAPVIVLEVLDAGAPRAPRSPPASPQPRVRSPEPRLMVTGFPSRALPAELGGPSLDALPFSSLRSAVRTCIEEAGARCEQGDPARCDQAQRHAASAESAEGFQRRAVSLREVQCQRAGTTGAASDAAACATLLRQTSDAATRARYLAQASEGQRRQEAIAEEQARQREAERIAEVARQEAERIAEVARREAERIAEAERQAAERQEALARAEAQRELDRASMRRDRGRGRSGSPRPGITLTENPVVRFPRPDPATSATPRPRPRPPQTPPVRHPSQPGRCATASNPNAACTVEVGPPVRPPPR